MTDEIQRAEQICYPLEKIRKSLDDITKLAQHSIDLQVILESAVKSLYVSLPNGERKYSGEKPEVGKVYLCFDRAHPDVEAIGAILMYLPSAHFAAVYNSGQLRVAKLDLRNKTYSNEHTFLEPFYSDTQKVLSALGLKEK